MLIFSPWVCAPAGFFCAVARVLQRGGKGGDFCSVKRVTAELRRSYGDVFNQKQREKHHTKTKNSQQTLKNRGFGVYHNCFL